MPITSLDQLSSIRDGDTVTLAAQEWHNAKIVLQDRTGVTLEAEAGASFTGTSSLKVSNCEQLTIQGLRFANGDLGVFGSDVAVISIEDSNNILLRKCAVVDYNPPTPTRSKEYKYLYIKTSPHTTVEHCQFVEKHNGSAALAVNSDPNQPDYCTIRRCLFKNIFPLNPSEDTNGYEAIRLSDSKRSLESSQSLIEECVLVNCGSVGEPEAISLKRCDITVRRCSLYNCQGFLTARHGKRNRFIENYIKDCSGGIRLIDSDHLVDGNYITGIHGDGKFRQAIVLVKGMEDSPINGYFAAHNAVIRNNSLIDNSHNIGITDGGKSELKIEPQNVKITEGKSIYETGTLVPLTEADLSNDVVILPPDGKDVMLQEILDKLNVLIQTLSLVTQKVEILSEHLGVR